MSPSPDQTLTPLCELARKYQTDKGGWHLHAGDTCHNYTPTYHKLLGLHRNEVRSVLEIGVNYGPSLRMWEEYFPNARILGIDCDARCLQYAGGRKRVVLADQGNAQSLLDAINTSDAAPFDFIVDDGSHLEPHQILSCRTLMPFLAPDGIYVIEDLDYDCQPEHYGDQLLPYRWSSFDCGVGLGKAKCHPACQKCGGKAGERLLVVTHV